VGSRGEPHARRFDCCLGTRTVPTGNPGGPQVLGFVVEADTFPSARSEIPEMGAESAYLMRMINPSFCEVQNYCAAVYASTEISTTPKNY